MISAISWAIAGANRIPLRYWPPATNTPSDLTLTGNSDVPTRKYWGVQFQAQYQLPAGFGAGGNYTYSKLTGNGEIENTGNGPTTFGGSSVGYKEFNNYAQNAPAGYLAADQRHKLRAWLTYDLGTRIGHFNLGLIQRFDSGTPFSASAAILVVAAAGQYPDGTPIPTDVNHKYANAPTSTTYFFGDRGAFRWDSQMATDVAVNYELPVHNFAFFAKAEVRNAFNHQAVIGGNTLVNTAATNSNFAVFNPFTTTPKECPRGTPISSTDPTVTTCKTMGANFQLGPTFGQAAGTATTFSQNGNYQLPRTYLYAVGMRF
jgi:hypothetical protein